MRIVSSWSMSCVSSWRATTSQGTEASKARVSVLVWSCVVAGFRCVFQEKPREEVQVRSACARGSGASSSSSSSSLRIDVLQRLGHLLHDEVLRRVESRVVVPCLVPCLVARVREVPGNRAASGVPNDDSAAFSADELIRLLDGPGLVGVHGVLQGAGDSHQASVPDRFFFWS